MPINSQIALSANPIISSEDQWSKIASLRQMLQQTRVARQVEQENQIKLDSLNKQMFMEATADQIFKKYKTPEEAMPELQQRLGGNALPYAEKYQQYRNALAEADSEELKIGSQKQMIIGNVLGSILNVPPQFRRQAIEKARSYLVQNRIVSEDQLDSTLPLFADENSLTFGAGLSMSRAQQFELTAKQKEEERKQAEEARKQQEEGRKQFEFPAELREKEAKATQAEQEAASGGKTTQHPITIEDPQTKQPVPAIQRISPDGTSKVILNGSEVPNPKMYRAPSVSLMNKSEMDDLISQIAPGIAAGDLSPIRQIASLRGDQRLMLYAKVKKLNPNFNTAEVDRKVKMEDWAYNGKGAEQIQSFGTFLEHAGAAKDALNSIYQSNTPAFNKPLNWWKKNLSGDANYQAYIASLEPVRKEFEGFLLGGRALYAEDRKSAEIILSDNASPAQQHAALMQLGHTAAARFNEINYRYKRLMDKDIEEPFAPEAIEGAQKIGVKLVGSAQAASAPKAETVDPMVKAYADKYFNGDVKAAQAAIANQQGK